MAQRALFIGVDDYPFEPLSSAVRDAVELQRTLTELGIFKKEECTLMTSPLVDGATELPTRDAILDFLNPLYNAQAPLDRLLVFYAGHGLSVRLGREADELRTVIVPAGVKKLRDSGGKMIDLDELVGRFARRGAREQFWIIDACRNLAPDGVLPNVATIGWDRAPDKDPRDAHAAAQGILYAVAPLGKAGAVVGGHGFLTTHVLDGLWCRGAAQWGSAAIYDESHGWIIDLESLCDYATRRLKALVPMATWQEEYQLPRVAPAEVKPGPLRNIGVLLARPFSVSVRPDDAAEALTITISTKGNAIAQWPPRKNGEAVPLPPERYRLTANLIDPLRWLPPKSEKFVVDVRDEAGVEIALDPRPDVRTGPSVETLGASSRDANPVRATLSHPSGPPSAPSNAATLPEVAQASIRVTDASGATSAEPGAIVIVHATDPGARVHMKRLSGGNYELGAAPLERVQVPAGLWRIDVRIGTDTISTCEEDLASGFQYEIIANAQVTPALAALMAPGEAYRAAAFPQRDLVVSETIGPMQGAILPTVLPLLAIKPFDRNNGILKSFAPRLRIPPYAQAHSPNPAALAIAFEGAWTPDALEQLRVGTKVQGGTIPPWWVADDRVVVYVDPTPVSDWVVVDVPDLGRFQVAAPRVRDRCATVSLTIWPDGRYDVSTSLFALPPGVDALVRPGRLSRALALAARFYQSGTSLDSVEFDVFRLISYGSWGDLVLGPLAWFGRARWLERQRDLTPEQRADIAQRQDGIRNFLSHNAPELPDTRIIVAHAQPEPQREGALTNLLTDDTLKEPVLAEGIAILAKAAIAKDRLEHWSVARFQRLSHDAVFNVTRSPSRPENNDESP